MSPSFEELARQRGSHTRFGIQLLTDTVLPEDTQIFWTRSWAQHKVWRAVADRTMKLEGHATLHLAPPALLEP